MLKDAGPPVLRFDSEQVRRFYDDNTRLFLSLGQGTEGTIHRAVWGPGVDTRVQAMAYVDRLVLERLQRLHGEGSDTPRHLVDLGSGVCASLCRMAKQVPMTGTGITISPAQVALAERRIHAEGLSARVRCILGDYCALPAELASADLAFAIESFVHAPDGAAFFAECAKLVRPGGYLIVCDDFLTAAGQRAPRRAQGWIQRFRQGWRASNLQTEGEARQLAEKVGFAHGETLDLSTYLETRRPRDYAIAALMRAFGWLPINTSYWSMLYGGHAGQLCIERGWVRHLFVVWQRT